MDTKDHFTPDKVATCLVKKWRCVFSRRCVHTAVRATSLLAASNLQ